MFELVSVTLMYCRSFIHTVFACRVHAAFRVDRIAHHVRAWLVVSLPPPHTLNEIIQMASSHRDRSTITARRIYVYTRNSTH